MPDILWTNNHPGEVGRMVQQVTDSDGGDTCEILIGGGVPDWARMPAELGGAIGRILDAKTAPCPICRKSARHYLVENARPLCVAECVNCQQFVWYEMKDKPDLEVRQVVLSST